MANEVDVLRKPRRSELLTKLKKYKVLYLMILPALIYYLLICYYPMAGLSLAFKDYSIRKGIFGSDWIGFTYFKTFFNSYDAPRLVLNTLRIGVIKCILEFPFPIIFALMINEVKAVRFKRVSQTISYLPHFFSTVIVVTILQKVFAPNVGLINQLKALFGGDASTFYLMEAKYFDRLLVTMDLWTSLGWSSILYLAAIAGIDPALYEAAEIDGASRIQRIRFITVPGIRGTIGILFIMGIGGLLSSGFNQILLLRTPGNMAVAETLDTYVVRIGLAGGQFGYATAIGLIQGVVGFIMIVTFNSLSRKFTEVSLW